MKKKCNINTLCLVIKRAELCLNSQKNTFHLNGEWNFNYQKIPRNLNFSLFFFFFFNTSIYCVYNYHNYFESHALYITVQSYSLNSITSFILQIARFVVEIGGMEEKEDPRTRSLYGLFYSVENKRVWTRDFLTKTL